MDLIEEVAREICRSGKFECGQGRCAVLCMDSLGDVRKSLYGCSHAKRLHGALAIAVSRLIVERCVGVAEKIAPELDELQDALRSLLPQRAINASRQHRTDCGVGEIQYVILADGFMLDCGHDFLSEQRAAALALLDKHKGKRVAPNPPRKET